MIKNVIFDIGNVLVEFRPQKTMRKIGIPEEKVDALLVASVFNKWWQELDRGFLPEKEVQEYMIADHPELENEIRCFFEKGTPHLVRSFDYSAGWLKSLKEKGLEIYLLSNYPESYFEIHSKKDFTFLPYVDGKIVSAYVKKIKPDPDIYRVLLETYGLNAQECVFLDDRKENIVVAQKLGFHTIWFRSYEEAREKLAAMLEKQAEIC